MLRCRVISAVELSPNLLGPRSASLLNPDSMLVINMTCNLRAGVVEWQTRRTQNPVGATLCGFKSRLRHQINQ